MLIKFLNLKQNMLRLHVMNSIEGLGWSLIGIFIPIYFFPLHVLFSGFAQERKLGRETGKLLAIPQVVAMFGPLIGGLIILNSNFKVLYLTAIILFAIDFIPILYTQIPGIKYEFKFGEGINLYKKYRKFFKAEIFSNIGEEIEGVIWPIFVYVSLINVASVGMIGTLLALSSAFYILAFFSGIFYVVFSVPYYSFFYRISQKEKATVFFAFREIPVAIARVIVFSLAIVFAANLKILFLVAGGAYLYFIFWKKVE